MARIFPNNSDHPPSAPARRPVKWRNKGAFIREEGLWPWVNDACQIVAARFELAGNISVEKHSDPELADEWITLRIVARGEIEQVLDSYDAVTTELIKILPPDVDRRLRLSVGFT